MIDYRQSFSMTVSLNYSYSPSVFDGGGTAKSFFCQNTIETCSLLL
ncbi:hypothetical protein STRMA_0015 [Streptococcus macacae NCTC 11558]|uniref:Uncharacterized protein n=1 Tax=Streptococcus macacae NCTC 11558 TaxID=764298 RepID=G5JXX0_9STRE|nr:hypothetical protein STRMA_0015 [Streptococcus macacae NCTC 11558]